MKKEMKKKSTKKAIKPRKIEVYLDMTDVPASEAIRRSKVEMGMLDEAVQEVATEILVETATNPTKPLKWYEKIWNLLKSLF